MESLSDFSDQRQKVWCIHCGQWLGNVETNVDHVPTKALLREPYPPNLPVVRVCKPCNCSFSPDEAYLSAFLGSVLVGSTDPDVQLSPSAGRILRHSQKLRMDIERSKRTNLTLFGKPELVWEADVERVRRVILKNARGHVLFEYGEPMLGPPTSIWFRPLMTLSDEERIDFESPPDGTCALWPEVGSRMMPRLVEGQDLRGAWVIVQDGVYRYSLSIEGGIRVKTILGEYLATEVCWDEEDWGQRGHATRSST